MTPACCRIAGLRTMNVVFLLGIIVFFIAEVTVIIGSPKYGYAWVSADDQHVDAQVRQLP